MRISSLHVVEVVLHERLNNVVEQLSVEIEVEYAEQSGINRSGNAEKGKNLINAAYKQLKETNVSVFSAIAIAIGAEYVSLNLPNAAAKADDLRALYAGFLADKSMFMRDPFAACGVNAPRAADSFTPEDMMKISRVIAY